MNKAKEYIDKNIDDIYDKFCDWYEDDGSYDDYRKAQIVAEFQTVINLSVEDVKELIEKTWILDTVKAEVLTELEKLKL